MRRLFLILFLWATPALATNYYVNSTISGASDSNDGVSNTINHTWLTVGKCASTIVAGDTCNITGGTYSVQVSATSHGGSADNNRITYLCSGGSKIAEFTTNQNYITVQACEFDKTLVGADGHSIVQVTGTNFTLASGKVHDSNEVGQECITIQASNAKIQNNEIYNCGTATAGVYNGNAITVDGPSGTVSNDLIDSNNIHQVGDCMNLGRLTDKLVYRRNTCGPVISDDSNHVDAIQANAPGGSSNLRTLAEGNNNYNATGANSHFSLWFYAIDQHFIERFNSTYESPGSMSCTREGDTTNSGCYVYNNTFVDNIDFAAGGNELLYNGTSTHVYSYNNLMYRANDVTYSPYASSPTTVRDYDLYYLSGNPAEAHQVNADPLFVNKAGDDLHLQATSPARSAGGALTTASGSGAGSTALTVAVAQFFQDGWAGVNPDCIAIGTVGNTACIVANSINYGTGAISLDTALSWSNGASVWLYRRSDGIQVLGTAGSATAPYIGAFDQAGAVTTLASRARAHR